MSLQAPESPLHGPSAISCAVLMCHAPIVIPAIAGSDARACSATTAAMRQTAEALVAHKPDLLVLISPHAPRRARSMGMVFEPQLHGDFSRFGHAELSLKLQGAPDAAVRVAQHAHARGVETYPLPARGLDHGSMVPLYFVHQAGYRGPVLLVSLPYPGAPLEQGFGDALRTAAQESGQRWAVLASGDMSHRLSETAPLGFDPRAHEFDDTFVLALQAGDLSSAISPDPELAELAAQDVVQSLEVAAAAVQYRSQGMHVFAYEAPFGVGYMEALLFTDRAADRALDDASQETSSPPGALIDIALAAIECALYDEPYEPPALPAPWHEPQWKFIFYNDCIKVLKKMYGNDGLLFKI